MRSTFFLHASIPGSCALINVKASEEIHSRAITQKEYFQLDTFTASTHVCFGVHVETSLNVIVLMLELNKLTSMDIGSSSAQLDM